MAASSSPTSPSRPYRDENGVIIVPLKWICRPRSEKERAEEEERDLAYMEAAALEEAEARARARARRALKSYPPCPRHSVLRAAQAMVSFERATLQLKPNQPPLRIYGSVEVLATISVCNFPLYEKDSSETILISPSSTGEVIDFPLLFPDWSVCSGDIIGFKVHFFDAEEDDAKPFLFQRGPCDGPRQLDEPLKFVAENDRASFILHYTRVKLACTVYLSFRIFNCVRGEYDRGECWANGSIKATQILRNGKSAVLTLFESSREAKFIGPSIPLLRPAVVVPVQTEEEGKGGWLQLNFDLELGTGDGNIVILLQGEEKLVLQPHHEVMVPFSLPTKITSRKRKIPMPSTDSDSDGIKIKIRAIPFYDPEYIHKDTERIRRALL